MIIIYKCLTWLLAGSCSMRVFNAFYSITMVCLLCIGCSETTVTESNTSETQTGYDAALAEKVGADDYGMKTFVIAFLKKGPNRDLPKEESDKLQSAHMENINKLAEDGKLVLAGPFYGEGDLRGIYVFDVDSIEKAEALTKTDPAIQAGSLVMELHKWYGSAATVMINEWHSKIQKTEI